MTDACLPLEKPQVARLSKGNITRFENVGLRYGLGPEVLRDVTFSLDQGSFHFLVGESGAGKSSLLKLMYLALKPSRGLISLFGCDIATTPRPELPALRRQIGVVFQEFRLLEHLSTFDNVALPLRVAGVSEKDVNRHVTELLEGRQGPVAAARLPGLTRGLAQCHQPIASRRASQPVQGRGPSRSGGSRHDLRPALWQPGKELAAQAGKGRLHRRAMAVGGVGCLTRIGRHDRAPNKAGCPAAGSSGRRA